MGISWRLWNSRSGLRSILWREGAIAQKNEILSSEFIGWKVVRAAFDQSKVSLDFLELCVGEGEINLVVLLALWNEERTVGEGLLQISYFITELRQVSTSSIRHPYSWQYILFEHGLSGRERQWYRKISSVNGEHLFQYNLSSPRV